MSQAPLGNKAQAPARPPALKSIQAMRTTASARAVPTPHGVRPTQTAAATIWCGAST